MIVKDVVCSSIMLQVQVRTRFAWWHLENEYVARRSVTLRLSDQYTQDIEEVYTLYSLYIPLKGHRVTYDQAVRCCIL